ncbi:MAG: hypothetical protein M1834_007326 [Cirrosporium novae-zelandiae]|nr:MAG: hypothetical protein M1834_007326 [Cirrosporium novae-zelandiae]
MLDENLPTFYLQPPTNKKQNETIQLSQYGNEASPVYSLRRLDPNTTKGKNQYAIAIYDSYNPNVLFAEVLLVPEWTKSSPTAEEIRLNNNVPPPPQPILPTSFTIQLYNPDQQIVVSQRKRSWNTNPSWGFEMPMQTFRQPSVSTIDRTLDDPAASAITPKLRFRWRRDGIAKKDLVCTLSGRSTNPDGSKQRNREPDITIALFRHLREITVYEPNLSRVEMEDFKGLEIVLLLGAAVIRDVYYTPIKEAFNIDNVVPSPTILPSLPIRKNSSPITSPTQGRSQSLSSSTPNPDPLGDWAKARAEAASQQRIVKILADEESERQRRQAEIDKETERLRKAYGEEERRARTSIGHRTPTLQMPGRPHSVAAPLQTLHENSDMGDGGWWNTSQRPGHGAAHLAPPATGPYLQPPTTNSSSFFGRSNHSNANGPYLQPDAGSVSTFFGNSSSANLAPGPRMKQKRSFFGLRSRGMSEDSSSGSGSGSRLSKKRSSMF